MYENFVKGFLQLLSMDNFIFINVGILLGIIFGAIPGLSGYLGIILLLPLTFSMNPVAGISMLLAIYCGGAYGGSISAILLGTPGSNEAAATVIDGYPLAKKGNAKKALQTALTASTIGGTISALVLLLAAPAISKLTLNFASPEYFAIAIFGMSIIAGVSGNNIIKGLICACFGFMISMVGIDELSGIYRFTFGNVNLISGLNMIGVMLGVFAIPVVLEKIEKKLYEIKSKEDIHMDKNDGFTSKDFKKCYKTIGKSSLIGTAIGALPGAGAAIAAFVSYNEAKRSSNTPEEFGHGALEGIAAPEAGNNAVTGAALIPLLTLAIPGSAAAAALIGGFMMHGLVPGPQLFKTQGPIMYTIMIGLIFTNLFMYLQGKLLSNLFSKVTHVPQLILVPVLLIFCFSGAFTATTSSFNIAVVIAFGIFSFVLGKLDFPQVPLVLGMILGPIAETNLRNSLIISKGSWLIFVKRPICLLILILTIVVIILLKKQAKNLEHKATQTQKQNALT